MSHYLDPTFGGISDLSPGELPVARDLDAELFNKRTIKDLVTNIEQELGLKPNKQKNKNSRRHARVITPSREDDGALLERILNDDTQYRILMWKDTWTVHGEYRIFVVYEEFLEDEKKKS